MDFKTAVERIGFPLAVLLFEDALPENTWQTATVDQCVNVRYAFSKKVTHCIGGKPIPQGMVDEANKRLQQIVAYADFKTARALCDKGSDFLEKIAYERLFSLTSTFEEACEVGDVIGLWSSGSSNDLESPSRARVTQLCFSKATRREHFAKLFTRLCSPIPALVGSLPKEDELKAAEKLLGDNPSDKELLLGYQFPSESPHYARALEKDLEMIPFLDRFHYLYAEVIEFPEHRAKVGAAFRKRLESATLEGNHDPYPYCRVCELATECGDEETAKACYNFVIANAEKPQEERFRQQGYRWIVNHADPESEEYKKFKLLLPTKRRKKELAEV